MLGEITEKKKLNEPKRFGLWMPFRTACAELHHLSDVTNRSTIKFLSDMDFDGPIRPRDSPMVLVQDLVNDPKPSLGPSWAVKKKRMEV